jgi:hypothetical protein
MLVRRTQCHQVEIDPTVTDSSYTPNFYSRLEVEFRRQGAPLPVSDLTALTLAEARDGLMMKRFSAVELTDAHLAAVEKARVLNAYVLETPDRATEMTNASDARIAKGDAGPLEGFPLAVKDTFCTKGVRTTAFSRILSNFDL